MEAYEKALFNRMRNYLEDKYVQELILMSDEEVKQEFYALGGTEEDL